MIINVVTAICACVLVAEAVFVIINAFKKNRAERIMFLRGFKKGKCAIIYVTAIPLYCMGHIYNGQDLLKAFFGAVSKIINLVVLKYDTSSIDSLIAVNQLYRYTVYLAFVLVGVNAVLFTLSLTSQHLWCAYHGFKAFFTSKDKLFILGNNKDNIAIYNSASKHSKAIVDNISDKASEQLYLQEIVFLSYSDYSAFIRRTFKRFKIFRRQYILVVNTGSDEVNMAVCRSIVASIEAVKEKDKERLFKNLRVFVFGDPKYEAIYSDIVSSSLGCIDYINKYQKVAVDFIDRYPLSGFMNEGQLDYDTSLVREGVDINVFMIGFGKTNQQIFLTSVANNQFLTEGENGPDIKPVKYHIFDRGNAQSNKNLNHSYYRYEHECAELDSKKYLPLPAIPAEEFYYRLDVNDKDFYDTIRNVSVSGEKNANFIIIAFGSDLENIDMAQKLLEKREKWGLKNLIIFVKAGAWLKSQTLLEQSNCYFIGNELQVVYNIDKIVNDRLFKMAKMRNDTYDLEYTITHNHGTVIDEEFLKKHHEKSNRNWHTKKTHLERESSIYCCLSLRSKLNLMGLDYAEGKQTDPDALTEDEYMLIYAGLDRPVADQYDITANGKPIISYKLNFAHSRRENMAIHEHQRWNSFMISKGIIPASIDQIKNEIKDGKHTNGKSYALRRHGNLTTFEGLVRFRQIVAERDETDESECDVIKYDYQLLDDAHWLLSQFGFKIVRKHSGN